ncbi:protein kinase [Oscillochloris sp. ZM17-4]|uniref:protein kinase domain-containing protein n=1 Tax=Oscillochloris sp. ZM17-4 TaxID=2866714 RepID=UPI001C734056|nr:protein kinase [Oscillochloris sp. ZM17-4]MBX0330378.1 protein kinase [Oscillochloris sp. ZM17-4]
MIKRHARVGGFVLLRRVGGGGQAEVYLARPAGGGRRAALAAIKVARPGHAAGLHDEHGWLAAAEHPGIAQLYSRRHSDLGYVESPGAGRTPFLALRYVPGRSLDELLARRRGRGLPADLAAHIATQAASALDHLHQRLGIVHQDVRPANLIIGAGRRPLVTLIDLGAAESLGAPRRRWDYGARGYMAPERLSGAPASPLADVYSLGITLRAMLSEQISPPALAGLIHDATEGDSRRRAAALPDMAAMLERLQIADRRLQIGGR